MLLQGTGSTINTIRTKEKAEKRKSDNDLPASLPPLMRIPISFYNVRAQALVDTGAAASFISLSLLKKLPFEKLKNKENELWKPTFRTVAGDKIKIKGVYEIDITLSDTDGYKHTFFILEHLDEGCILGIDFLNNLDIVISAKDRSLLYKHEEKVKKFKLPTYPLYNIKIEPENKFNLPEVPKEYLEQVRTLLYENYDLFAEKMSELGMATAIKHTIELETTRPINLPLRRTPEAQKLEVRTQIDEMLAHNIIRESSSPYAAPVVLVPKKGGELRFCIDYRQLNKATVKDRYPLPRIDDTIDALHGAKIFSTLDLFSGYWQIEIEEKDKNKTAFICEYGQFEFNRMPFGLTNAPATFQRLMNRIMRPVLYKSTLVYLDDIIVFSKSIDDHIKHLATVFKLLAENGLKLKLKKCEFCKDKIDYLGHIVSRDGVMPNPKKIQAIVNYPEPRNSKELSSFLGLASYYRRFIRAFAEKAHPLTMLTRKNVAWEWGDAQRDAFTCIRQCLTSQPILRYPDFARKFIIYTDASGYGIGAVLAQIQGPPHSADQKGSDEEEVVIAYSSKHLDDRQSKWSTTEKEAYAIVHAITVFKPYLYGRKFTVFTDHKPLEWLMSKVEPAGRLARWALKIQEYDIEIGYRAGKDNQNADTLSRTPIQPIALTLQSKNENNEWKQDQEEDKYCSQILKNLREPSKSIQSTNFRITNEGELVYKEERLVVPEKRIKEILELNHDHMLAGHLGVAKTIARIKKRYYWPHWKQIVIEHVNNCMICAKRKATGGSKAPLKPLQPVERVFERIAMDIVGPVHESRNGNKYILVLSDYASRFAITIPMVNQKAPTVAEHFVNEVISKYGAPENVLTDQGTNFLSLLIKNICELFKINQLRTTSYHPQTDGLVERFNRTLCDMLACYVNEEPEKWDKFLPFVTLAYNTTEQATLKQTPFYLFYGREATLPNEYVVSRRYQMTENHNEMYKQKWQLALEFARTNLEKAQRKQKENYDVNSKLTEYNIGDSVLLKSPPVTGKFNNRWIGPYIIMRKFSFLNYEIKPVDSNRRMTVHINRLKKDPTKKPLESLNSETEGQTDRESNDENEREKETRSQQTMARTTETSPVQPKRRGRPPKNVMPRAIAQQASDTRENIQTSSEPIKRRGRPRKNSTPEAIERNNSNKEPKKITHDRNAERDLKQWQSNYELFTGKRKWYDESRRGGIPIRPMPQKQTNKKPETSNEQMPENNRYNLRARSGFKSIGSINMSQASSKEWELVYKLGPYEMRVEAPRKPHEFDNYCPEQKEQWYKRYNEQLEKITKRTQEFLQTLNDDQETNNRNRFRRIQPYEGCIYKCGGNIMRGIPHTIACTRNENMRRDIRTKQAHEFFRSCFYRQPPYAPHPTATRYNSRASYGQVQPY